MNLHINVYIYTHTLKWATDLWAGNNFWWADWLFSLGNTVLNVAHRTVQMG